MKAAFPWMALIAAAWIWLPRPASSAQDYGVDTVPFPSNPTSERVVQAWIDRYLPTRGYAIGAWSANVVMLVSVDGLKADAYPQVTTDVLTETLSAKAANAAGWRAALQTMAFDCAQDRYRTVSSLYFARGDRKGGFDQDAGSNEWLMPESGATMDTVERAACFYGQRKHEAGPASAPPAKAHSPSAPPAASAPRPTSKRPGPVVVQAKPAPLKPSPTKRAATHPDRTKTTATKTKRPAATPAPHPRSSEVTPQLRGFELQ